MKSLQRSKTFLVTLNQYVLLSTTTCLNRCSRKGIALLYLRSIRIMMVCSTLFGDETNGIKYSFGEDLEIKL